MLKETHKNEKLYPWQQACSTISLMRSLQSQNYLVREMTNTILDNASIGHVPSLMITRTVS